MSKMGLAILAVLFMLSLVPFAFIAKSRASRSPNAPIHLVMDMDDQPKKKTQSPSILFKDGRSMRPHIDGTFAREDMFLDSEILNDPTNPRTVAGSEPIRIGDPVIHAAVVLGRTRAADMTDDKFNAAKPVSLAKASATDDDIAADPFYVKTIPTQINVSAEFIRRGQERFNIYCSPCHGQSGYGDGPIHVRANAIAEQGALNRNVAWTQPQDLNAPKIVTRPDGHLFNTITNGIRTMPAYDKQISVADRWAIVAYLRAVQTSQNAPPELTGNANP
jgi:mono/diheme cytochrome c family protein